jgi:hypothetical protein
MTPSAPSQRGQTLFALRVPQAWVARKLETYLAADHRLDLSTGCFSAAPEPVRHDDHGNHTDGRKDLRHAVSMGKARRQHDDHGV